MFCGAHPTTRTPKLGTDRNPAKQFRRLPQRRSVRQSSATSKAQTIVNHHQLVILTKVPGSGKSRLAASVGSVKAAMLAHAFLVDTLALASNEDWSTTLSVALPGAEPWMRALAREATFTMQPEGDLGVRVSHAICDALEGSERAVLIGSDTPDLPVQVVRDAFAALDSAELVVGPAVDGGFYLLGARQFDARLLAGIEWSTPSVCERLLHNARALGLSFTTLEAWSDVDDGASLTLLANRLDTNSSAAPATRAALQSMVTA